MQPEIATFGAVHLSVTDIQRSTDFWREIVGLEVRRSGDIVELGTQEQTLVVLHAGATSKVKNGYSGIYHLAIHLPTESEFARVLARLITKRWPISPTDHIMHKAIYLEDPDGITIEIAFETPERFKSYSFENGRPQIIDSEGRVRRITEALDVEEVLSLLADSDINKPMPVGTKIGHMHLYVGNLQDSFDFYKSLGFSENMFSADMQFADLSAGGIFRHRIAINTWQGINAPQAPEDTAGMKYFVVKPDTEERRQNILKQFPSAEKISDGYLIKDPSSNSICITNN